VIVAVGLQFRSSVESAQDTIIGSILIVTGVAFLVMERRGRHHHHDHDHLGEGHGLRGLAAVMVPFGAAASPDLTILPVFLAASAVGVSTAVGSLLVFALVTVATFVGLTVVTARGGSQIRGEWLERWGNSITALVLLLIGALVLGRVI
jgi:hypothetical protein